VVIRVLYRLKFTTVAALIGVPLGLLASWIAMLCR